MKTAPAASVPLKVTSAVKVPVALGTITSVRPVMATPRLPE